MTATPPTRLRDIAIFVRSKNAGPFMITIDLFFDGPESIQRVLESDILSPGAISALYGPAPEEVKLIHVAQANALKVSFPRPLAAGDIGDSDVAGGQQFLPLLDLIVPERSGA